MFDGAVSYVRPVKRDRASSPRRSRSAQRVKRAEIISLVGARPQFVKLAPLAQRLAGPRWANYLRHTIVHSGQHYDPLMSEVFFRDLTIPSPKVNLEVGSGPHGRMTARMLERFERLLLKRPPKAVIVYGDTNTTLAGALAAVKLGIPLIHVEAGLRSFDPQMPEEINRVVTDHCATLLLSPTVEGVRNLCRERVQGRIARVGDLMYEVLDSMKPLLGAGRPVFARLGLIPGEYYLATVHRAENVDTREALSTTLDALSVLDRTVIFAVHPRTRAALIRFKLMGAITKLRHVRVNTPLPYADNLALARHSRAVVTDSGGLQKEAIFLGAPCLTLRDRTEWPETLSRGNALVGRDARKIKAAMRDLPQARPPIWRVNGRTPSACIVTEILRLIR